MQYFIADTHFFHESVIHFSQRPYENIEEMNRQLIHNWNNKVQSDRDEVYILGDFLYRGTGVQANEMLKQLRGKKYLIKGNHEKYLKDKAFDASAFEWVKDYHTFKYHKRKFVLFHYPILEWDGFFKGSIHLYGHVHNTRVTYFKELLGPNAINVCEDMLDFTHISIDEVLTLVYHRQQERELVET